MYPVTVSNQIGYFLNVLSPRQNILRDGIRKAKRLGMSDMVTRFNKENISAIH